MLAGGARAHEFSLTLWACSFPVDGLFHQWHSNRIFRGDERYDDQAIECISSGERSIYGSCGLLHGSPKLLELGSEETKD
jgi:hypothetical protein